MRLGEYKQLRKVYLEHASKDNLDPRFGAGVVVDYSAERTKLIVARM